MARFSGSFHMLKIFLKSPIYYHVAIYNFIAENDLLPFHVYYASDVGITPYNDREMPDVERVWITEEQLSHPHEYVRSIKLSKWDGGFAPRVSPGILKTILLSAKDDVFLLQGFSNIDEVLALLTTKIMRRRVIFRGEGFLPPHETHTVSFASRVKRMIKRFYLSHVKDFMYSTETNMDYMEVIAPPHSRFYHFPSISQPVLPPESSSSLPDKPPHSYVIASRLTDRKCVPQTLALLLRVLPDGASVSVLGEGPDLEAVLSLRSDFEERGIALHTPGFVDHKDAVEILLKSRFYLNLSDYDPSPKALNEATECGCSVILSSGVGTHKDLIGKNAVLVLDKSNWKDGSSDHNVREFIHAQTKMKRAKISGYTPSDCAKGLADAYYQSL